MFQKILAGCLFVMLAYTTFAQNATLKGQVTDLENNQLLSKTTVVIANTGRFVETDENGYYEITELNAGEFSVSATHIGYYPLELPVVLTDNQTTTLNIQLRKDPSAQAEAQNIPTILLDEVDSQLNENTNDIANLLTANRDVYQNITSFGWFPFRFRERGYDSYNFRMFLNGIPMNDPETGFVFFGKFGGMNDVLRDRETVVGLGAADFTFGDLGGATIIDTRASRQRQQLRVSYASTNRAYRNRIMATYSTGLMPKGWAISVSGSRRWAQEGYIPGTFYDGYAYFLSVDKVINERHSFSATVMGTPTTRGRSTDTYQEMYDIAGTNYYNGLWGFWNGDKRNSRVVNSHQPIGMLRYDYTPSELSSVTAVAYAQGGRYGSTRLNWLDAPNPVPDFNRRLPSSLEDPGQQALWTQQLSENEALRQIDWFEMYDANSRNFASVENVDGIEGNTVEGKRALYMVEEQRSDSRELGFNVYARHTLNPNVTLNGGVNYSWYTGENYKTVDDLLGSDFWLDYDFYSIFDPLNVNNDGRQSDLQNPNNLVEEGEIFGYNYNDHIQRGSFWGQGQFTLSKFQMFAGAEVTTQQYWREGFMQNGRFPDRSLGESDKEQFTTYNLKGGLVYKLNGRNYFYVNGLYGTSAPRYRDTYISPRTREDVVPNLEVATIQSIEGGYQLRAPYYRIRVTGYLTEFRNETVSLFANAQTVSKVIENIDVGDISDQTTEAFLNAPIFFGSATLQGQDRRHMGVEAAIEAKAFTSWVFTLAGTVGNHIYTNRPQLLLSLDNNALPLLDAGQVYQKNFYVPRTPQSAGSFRVKYEGRRYWFASLTANYADASWYDFDRLRRTTRYVANLEQGSEAYNLAVDQIQAPSAFTLDLFGGKSWKFGNNYFIYLNVGINNILNNQDIQIFGRESYRNAFRRDITDPRFYTTELIYAPGINYFASLTFRI